MVEAYHPLNNGFTSFYGTYTGGLDYFTHVRDGRQVRVLVDDTLPAGRHTAMFEAHHLPSGLYVARLVTPAHTFTRMLVLVK